MTSKKGVALNEKNIFIAETSSLEVSKAHHSQFKEDFTLFLSSRAKELVPGGRMVLTFQGSVNSDDPDSIFELLGSTLHTMVQEVTFKNLFESNYMQKKKEKIDFVNMSVKLAGFDSGVWVDEIFRSIRLKVNQAPSGFRMYSRYTPDFPITPQKSNQSWS